jgi:hypothetical protein
MKQDNLKEKLEEYFLTGEEPKIILDVYFDDIKESMSG